MRAFIQKRSVATYFVLTFGISSGVAPHVGRTSMLNGPLLVTAMARMPKALVVLRWAARLTGLLVTFGYVTIVAAEILQPHSAAPPSQLREWVGIILLSVACLAVVAAWRWELPSTALSLAALVSFVAVVGVDQPRVVAVLATPGILHLLDWLIRRLFSKTGASTET